MLWFSKNKGLATGIAISGFGLAKVLASPLIEYLQKTVGIVNMFYILAGIYLLPMILAYLLIKKPNINKTKNIIKKDKFKISSIFKNKSYLAIWFIFFMNITCGLALISQEKPLMQFIGFSSIAFISALTAAFNTLGRFRIFNFRRLSKRSFNYL